MGKASGALFQSQLFQGQWPKNEPIGLTVFIAAVLHALFIFGITFSEIEKRSSAQSLEITLAQHKSATAPIEADFLAQNNQEASGTKDEKLELTASTQADFHDNVARDIEPERVTEAKAPKPSKHLITTLGQSSFQSEQSLDPHPKDVFENEIIELMHQRQQEIASLEAKLAEQKQAYAKRPRKRQLSAEATKESRDALYLDAFRRRVERVGNQHYPLAAKARKIFGDVRLLVAINSNGSVQNVRVLKSSGHRILDDAAIRSVKLAAPFAPFSAELKHDADILEIIRTWRFEQGSYFSR